jgi:hypothetical protein
LGAEFGRGFEEKNLRRMPQFAEAFPDELEDLHQASTSAV